LPAVVFLLALLAVFALVLVVLVLLVAYEEIAYGSYYILRD
jgi:hypothetical protein